MKKDSTKKIDVPNKDVKDIEEEIVVEQESEILACEKKSAEYLDGWKRCQADFENYKKMQNDSQKDLVRYAASSILLQIIPVLDNFQMSTAHIPEDQKDGGWVVGIMHIQKQLENVLKENGVEEIAVKVGDTFDPIMHEAIEDKECLHCSGEKKFENKIKKVVMNGYKMGEKIIRPARVVVE
ncbi:MAG: hypothetical protein ACD_56C00030G0001 [uncultured bacterium]|nr:MAG: hypothetical protein ACD_56C00030G0001 [uncultured bacterium]